jgi:hypothetical protein
MGKCSMLQPLHMYNGHMQYATTFKLCHKLDKWKTTLLLDNFHACNSFDIKDVCRIMILKGYKLSNLSKFLVHIIYYADSIITSSPLS